MRESTLGIGDSRTDLASGTEQEAGKSPKRLAKPRIACSFARDGGGGSGLFVSPQAAYSIGRPRRPAEPTGAGTFFSVDMPRVFEADSRCRIQRIASPRRMGLDESGFDGQWTDEDVRERQRIVTAFETAEGFGRGSKRYSTRRALTGSMDAARQAGIKPAMQAARASTPMAPAITVVLTLVISYSCDLT